MQVLKIFLIIQQIFPHLIKKSDEEEIEAKLKKRSPHQRVLVVHIY